MSIVNTECHPFHTTKIQNARYVQATAHSTPLKSRLINAVESTNSTSMFSWDTSSANGSSADPSDPYKRLLNLKTDYAWLTLEFEFEDKVKKTDSQESGLRSCDKVASRCCATTRQPAEKPLADKKRKRDARTSEDDQTQPSSHKKARSSSHRQENKTTTTQAAIMASASQTTLEHANGACNPTSVPFRDDHKGHIFADDLKDINVASDWEIPTITIVPASPRDPEIEYANCANGGMPQDPAFLMTPDVRYTASSEEDLEEERSKGNLGEAGEKDELDSFWEWSLS